MNVAARYLGLDAARWARVGVVSFWPAVAWAMAASLLLAFNRFGGAAVDAPRAFLRMALIGVFGWLGLATAIWILASQVSAGLDDHRTTPRSVAALERTFIAVGLAHAPIVVFGLVIFVAAGLLQLLGPGLATALFVYLFWFPASLVMATASTFRVGYPRAASLVILPYALWYLTAGQHLFTRVEHLL
jgi:hypothetical protein